MEYFRIKKLSYQTLISSIKKSTSVLVVLLISQQVQAATSIMTRYVGIDSVTKTSYLYDEQFTRLPDNPFIPKTSISVFPDNKTFWYLGGTVDVVRRNSNGTIDVLSDDPAYSEMVHHLTWGYKSPTRTRNYPCGIARPLAAGSELSNFYFPKGYAYKFNSGVLMPVSWHWSNPANVSPTEKIYVRFNLIMDDNPTGYKDTNVDWIDTVPCKSTFSVPSGKSKKVGAMLPVATNRRIIAVAPHHHDHVKYIKLNSTKGLIREFFPENQFIAVEHDDVGQGPTPLHSNKDHLPVNGIYTWTPGKYGPIVTAGESLWIESKYKNVHPRSIDSMALTIIYWVDVQ